jgi:ADP-ribosyl-[dinitrogen reductase] hydrolase
MMMRKSQDKVLGALLGVAAGDALGAPLEFMSASEIRAKHGEVREMLGGGWLSVVPGEITDDTQMTLAVAEGIAENPNDPIPAIGRRFIEWYDSGPKDVGNACRAAIAYAKRHEAKSLDDWLAAARRVHDETGGRTAGNGALMRTIYPALYYGGKGHGVAADIGRMTHIHDDSAAAVVAYTWAIGDITGADKDIYWGKERIERHMRSIRARINKLNPPPDGYVLNSLVCALNAIRDTNSFEGALVYAVNLGGDADTIGAITGGLAGALYGAEAIPRRWLDKLDAGIRKRLAALGKVAVRA